MDITYEIIKPILKKEIPIDDNQIHIEFKAENQPVSLYVTAFLPIKKTEKKKRKINFIKKRKNKTYSYIDDKIKKQAIVRAFKTISIFYEYDKKKQKWIFKAPY